MNLTSGEEAEDLLVLDEEEYLFDIDEFIDFSHDEPENPDELMLDET